VGWVDGKNDVIKAGVRHLCRVKFDPRLVEPAGFAEMRKKLAAIGKLRGQPHKVNRLRWFLGTSQATAATQTSRFMYKLELSLKKATRLTINGKLMAARMFFSLMVCSTCAGDRYTCTQRQTTQAQQKQTSDLFQPDNGRFAQDLEGPELTAGRFPHKQHATKRTRAKRPHGVKVGHRARRLRPEIGCCEWGVWIVCLVGCLLGGWFWARCKWSLAHLGENNDPKHSTYTYTHAYITMHTRWHTKENSNLFVC
jgi:hypothetical protein